MNSNMTQPNSDQRERVLRILSRATFIIFFQAFMVAPIIPWLSEVFGFPHRRLA